MKLKLLLWEILESMLLISNKDDVSIDLAKVQLLRGNNKIEAKRVGIFNRAYRTKEYVPL